MEAGGGLFIYLLCRMVKKYKKFSGFVDFPGFLYYSFIIREKRVYIIHRISASRMGRVILLGTARVWSLVTRVTVFLPLAISDRPPPLRGGF